MMRWLEGNPVGIAFAGAGGGLLAVSLLLGVFWAMSPSGNAPGAGAGEEAMTLNVPELADSEPLEAYTVITERPVFNEDRRPAILDDSLDGEDEDDLEEEPVDAPEVELAGVVITPSIRMATLRVKDETESLVAFEGQPLEGNFGTWQVSRILPREVTLSSGDGRDVQLKLQVHDATIKAPPKPAPKVAAERPASTPQDEAGESDQPLSRAEEIRQRIAERREELRRAAEDNEASSPKPQDYRSAIQAMIRNPNQTNQADKKDEGQ